MTVRECVTLRPDAPHLLELPAAAMPSLSSGTAPSSDDVSDTRAGKSKIINKAVQDIGMGTYNWQLFVLCGFGWFADKYGPLPLTIDAAEPASLSASGSRALP